MSGPPKAVLSVVTEGVVAVRATWLVPRLTTEMSQKNEKKADFWDGARA